MEEHANDLKETIEMLKLEDKLDSGLFDSSDFERVKFLSRSGSPRGVYTLGKAIYLGIGTSKNHEEAMRCFEYVYEHGNFEILTELFMLLMDESDDKIKIMIVNALQKAKKEYEEIMKIALDDDFLEEELPIA